MPETPHFCRNERDLKRGGIVHWPSGKTARLIGLSVLLCPTLVQPQTGTGYASDPNLSGVRARYLGVAGWEITDGKTHILIDPYLSRLPGPPAGGGAAGPGWPGKMKQDDPAVPDIAAIDRHIDRADFILPTHAHYVHALDAPYIARTRKAVIVGNESVANIARDYGVP